jgi:formylmethanofuran dehydrogenase subunit E
MKKTDLDILIGKAKEFHGEICPGIIIGVRIAVLGMEYLDMNVSKKNKDLIVFVEVDRCISDAIQSVTGCSLGHRTLKPVDYGKLGATFLDITNNKAVRISAIAMPPENLDEIEMNSLLKRVSESPDEELFKLQKVKLILSETDSPGPPSNITTCSKCSERIIDHREIISNGKTFCQACAGEAYYKVEDD